MKIIPSQSVKKDGQSDHTYFPLPTRVECFIDQHQVINQIRFIKKGTTGSRLNVKTTAPTYVKR